MLNETDKYLKILNTMQKTDSLLLLYMEGNDQITVPIATAINESKGKVIYDEIKPLKNLNKEIAIAYRLGALSVKYEGIKVVSNNELLLELINGSSVSKTKTNNVAKKEAKELPAVKEEMPRKNTKPAAKTPGRKSAPKKDKAVPTSKIKGLEPLPAEGKIVDKDEPTLPEVTPSSIKEVKTRKPRTPKIKEGTFEYEFNRLKELCLSLKTKAFNPFDYVSSISKAVKDAQKNNCNFEESINLYMAPGMAKKVIEAFKGKTDELFEIVEKMHSYDNE